MITCEEGIWTYRTDGAPITVKIIEDSINDDGNRLVTYCWEYPRMIHSEVMTHRVMSRNAASSRAIPAQKLRKRTLDAPAMPVHWGQNQAGMQAGAEIEDVDKAKQWWRDGLTMMAEHHKLGEGMGLHKQVINRVIEPWMTIAIIVSMTEHANFFHLRDHPMAEPSIQVVAKLAWEAFNNNKPKSVAPDKWHLPYVDEDRSIYNPEYLCKLSSARCARVSYLTHEGTRDAVKDVELHDKLVGQTDEDPMHASPLEHPAVAVRGSERHGNFVGWKQYRKFFHKEAGPRSDKPTKCCGMWVQKGKPFHTAACYKKGLT